MLVHRWLSTPPPPPSPPSADYSTGNFEASNGQTLWIWSGCCLCYGGRHFFFKNRRWKCRMENWFDFSNRPENSVNTARNENLPLMCFGNVWKKETWMKTSWYHRRRSFAFLLYYFSKTARLFPTSLLGFISICPSNGFFSLIVSNRDYFL